MFVRLIAIAAVTCAAVACGSNALTQERDAAVDAGEDGTTREDARPDRMSSSDAGEGLVVLPAQFTEEGMPLRMLTEGDPIELWAAPQGGRVVLVGAKVKNVRSENVLLRVHVGYPDTPFIIAQEARTAKMLPVPDEPDTKQPDLASRSHVAHVPLCPDYDPFDIVDRPVEVYVQVTEREMDPPRTGEATLRVIPTCVPGSPGAAVCRCECQANYFLGKCAPDASPGD